MTHQLMHSCDVHHLLSVGCHTAHLSHVPIYVPTTDHTFTSLNLDIIYDLDLTLLNSDGILIASKLPPKFLSLGDAEEDELTIRDNLDPLHVHSCELAPILDTYHSRYVCNNCDG